MGDSMDTPPWPRLSHPANLNLDCGDDDKVHEEEEADEGVQGTVPPANKETQELSLTQMQRRHTPSKVLFSRHQLP